MAQLFSVADQRKHQSSASRVTSVFPSLKASNAENISIWWRHHHGWGHCDSKAVISLRKNINLRTMSRSRKRWTTLPPLSDVLSCINIAIAGATSVIPETDVTVYGFLAFHYLLIQNTLWHGDIYQIISVEITIIIMMSTIISVCCVIYIIYIHMIYIYVPALYKTLYFIVFLRFSILCQKWRNKQVYIYIYNQFPLQVIFIDYMHRFVLSKPRLSLL